MFFIPYHRFECHRKELKVVVREVALFNGLRTVRSHEAVVTTPEGFLRIVRFISREKVESIAEMVARETGIPLERGERVTASLKMMMWERW